MLIDTHCHIHEADYPLDTADVLREAREAGVAKLICVGTDLASSTRAIAFADAHDNVFSAIGVHPHEAATDGSWRDGGDLERLLAPTTQAPNPNLVAIGEIGLDYFYEHSPRDIQIQAFRAQLQLAAEHNLPVIFHVRDQAIGATKSSVWDDFWSIMDEFPGIRGVLHSFTDNQANLDKALTRGFFIGVNGISTFTKVTVQQQLFAGIPLDKLLLETDAPFLTPAPLRGKVNQSAYVRYVAEHQATLRGVSIDDVSAATTTNAHALFAV